MSTGGKDLNKSSSKNRELAAQRAETAELKKDLPNPVWFKPVMFGFMLLGLVWIVVYYITSSTIQLPVPQFGQANIFVGFGLVLVGFLMTPWWK